MIRRINGAGKDLEDFFACLAERNRMESEEISQRVAEIVQTVKHRGDQAVLEYTRKFDGVETEQGSIRISEEEISQACRQVDEKLMGVIRRAKANIEAFHGKQKQNSWFSTGSDGILLGQLFRPLSIVGIYVPGGTAPLPSSVLMNAIPARVAGVERVVMATPPGRDGRVSPAILAAAKEAGVDEIYRMGGAQAIAAMAFGTETVPQVDKIVGPGNIYVAFAKRMVYGTCDIDMFAGPSEILVVADETANPTYAAADLLSQAEHDVRASAILVTTSRDLADKVETELQQQVACLSRKEYMEKSLESYGAIITTDSLPQCIEIANRLAPEHLELCVSDPFALLDGIRNAGAVFLGHYAPEPLGDYFAGPNHVLPTSGTARFFSPLSVHDFVKKSSVISYSAQALSKVQKDVVTFAEAEGLTAHANAVRVRFEKDRK